jgi:hypothetical protein
MRTPIAALVAALSLVAVPAASADQMGPDWVSSDNVEYLGSIKQDFGLTAGAKIVGDRMFVTSGKNITIYDISTPETPVTLGSLKVNVAWENEEVPTNGKVLAVASDFYSAMPSCVTALAVDGCVQFFDVRDPANIQEVGSVPIANHTAECVLDCQWFYGRAGTIIDARGILDGKEPAVVGNWIEELQAQGVDSNSCHHIREIRPGVLLTACQPFSVITVNPKDAPGASPEHPKVLYTGEAEKFVHSSRWPRGGKDKFVLTAPRPSSTASPISSRDRCSRSRPHQTAPTPTGVRRRITSGAQSTGSRSTSRSRTAAWSRCLSTRTACASCRSTRTARSRSRASSRLSGARRRRRSGRRLATSSTRSITTAASTSSAGRASTTSRRRAAAA